jgi:7-cyano-7-deazaguanine tRNA-ribosyltransferase
LFEIKYTDLGGRIGLLETKHGKIETPALFPVIDVYRQELEIGVIRSLGFNQVITNSYLLYKRYGSKLRSIHELLGFDGVVMTDSGAYQILQYGNIEVTQDTILDYQKRIDVDIGVILDIPTGDSDYSTAKKTVELTLKRAKDALEHIDPASDKIIWVLPIQGGKYLDLIDKSAKEAMKLPYKMYSIGSPTVFLEKYMYHIIGDMVYTARKTLPWGKPLHLFGAGHPIIIPYMVALGVDTFDSASYILYARDNRIMTRKGVHRLSSLDYMPCNTDICNRYTPKELLEMDRNERTRLLALHNLQVINSTIRETKQAIKEGRLWELLNEYSRSHKSAYELFMKFRKYYTIIEKHTPITLPNPKGRRLIGPENFWNPLVIRHIKYLLNKHNPKTDEINVYPPNYELCGGIGKPGDYILLPYFGLIPLALCRSYPYSQHDYSLMPSTEICNKTSIIVFLFIIKKRIKRINFYRTNEIPCYYYIKNKLLKKGIIIDEVG